MKIVNKSNLPLKLINSGKVREVYDAGDNLLIVTSDRISAFDVVMNEAIPYKGVILNNISKYWFEHTEHICESHFINDLFEAFPSELVNYEDEVEGRAMLVKKCEPIPIEFVIRNYIAGSGWNEYTKTGEICGNKLPTGLKKYEKLPHPIFTPATKATDGHDENISFDKAAEIIGSDLLNKVLNIAMDIFNFGSKSLEEKGIILADTKFEFGLYKDRIVLIDEVLTPDSSRFWMSEGYEAGKEPYNFDKQILRDYLETCNWDKTPPAPNLQEEIVNKTFEKYKQIYKLITDNDFDELLNKSEN